MTTLLLAIGFGIVIGLLLGIIGGGGSILTVPILVYILDQPAHEATTTSLIVVGLTALVGLIPHARAGRVAWKTATLIGIAGVPGAVLGTWLNRMVSGTMLLGLFGLLMVTIAALMLTARPRSRTATASHPLLVAATGLGIGILTGFFGVGGGFLIVPALVMLLGLSMPLAVGSSLLVIAINAVASSVSHGLETVANLPLALMFVAGGSIGSLAGARLAGRLDEVWLRRGFAAFVASLGVLLVVINGRHLIA